ncbi:hypothetical protein [Candidatus Electronema sp. TJ]|uniref:hypothetical protein n=1 Tax=Candidatus Electronema sp. TJ TaxID=3401573 RepID=UPI003AA81FDE
MGIKFIDEPTPINRELRIEILECALKLEANINTLLLELLDIPDSLKKKSLSGKSGSLSFKNKIDLLSDIEVISDDEYGEFILLMEFRNKFLHDLYCNSFMDALLLCGEHRNNTMLRLVYGIEASKNFSKNKNEKNRKITEYDSMSEQEKERICLESFINLFDRTVCIVKNKIELAEKEFQGRINLIRTLSHGMAFYCKRYTDFLVEIDGMLKKHNLPDALTKLIVNECNFFTSSEEVKKYSQIDASFVDLFNQKRRKESQQD